MGNLQNKYDKLFGSRAQDGTDRIGDVVFGDKNLSHQSNLHPAQYEAFQGDSINQYIKTISDNQVRMDIRNLFMPTECRVKKPSMCEQTQFVQLFYDDYDFWLRNQLITRRSRYQSFSEEEAWYIIMTVLNGLRQIQALQLTSVPLTLDSIKLNRTGQIKIINIFSSPEDYDRCVHNMNFWGKKSIFHFHIEQTYNLGIVILQMLSRLWIPERGEQKYNGEDIQRSFFQLTYQYSELLCTLLSVMLSHPKDRPLPSQVYQVFQPFLFKIMNFQPFSFAPNLMKSSIMQSQLSNYTNYMNLSH